MPALAPVEKVLTTPEILALLRISKNSLTKYHREHKLPVQKLGGKYLALESQLIAYLKGEWVPLPPKHLGRPLKIYKVA